MCKGVLVDIDSSRAIFGTPISLNSQRKHAENSPDRCSRPFESEHKTFTILHDFKLSK